MFDFEPTNRFVVTKTLGLIHLSHPSVFLGTGEERSHVDQRKFNHLSFLFLLNPIAKEIWNSILNDSTFMFNSLEI